MAFDTLLLDISDHIATVTINRPDKRNALNATVRRELVDAFDQLRDDDSARVVVITGAGEKAFVAGADIGEFAERTPLEQREAMQGRRIFDEVAAFPKPVIAMINGFALGGGCELAMMCDFILAADTAKFGQPEIKLGVMPGMGGSQRLTRAIGKSKAMEMCLTGRNMGAEEAERAGLVARIVPADELIDDALKTAATIAGMSKPIAQMTKEAVNRVDEVSLSEGIRFERRVFHAMFATEDQKEGMAAFVEKRKPVFKGR